MSFKVGRLAATALVVSLLVEMQISQIGYAAFKAKIVFTCWGGDSREICVMDADGGNEVRLTDDPKWNHQPSWSPDGTRIAFNRSYHINVMDSDGQNLTGISSGSEPALSPSGDTIAYVAREEDVSSTIDLMTPAGIHLEQLTEDDGTNRYNPVWFDPVGWSVSPATNFVTIWGKIKVPASVRR